MKTYTDHDLRNEIGTGGIAFGYYLGAAKGKGRYFIPQDVFGGWEWKETTRLKYYVYCYRNELFQIIPGDVKFALDRKILKHI
jgi:hypothetical protein